MWNRHKATVIETLKETGQHVDSYTGTLGADPAWMAESTIETGLDVAQLGLTLTHLARVDSVFADNMAAGCDYCDGSSHSIMAL
ncbi:hypothetical protein ACLOJK_029696 [Asimina triloba]